MCSLTGREDRDPFYEEKVFTRTTLKEVDFLIEEMAPPPGSSILDVGCGTERHSIQLTKRGYTVTGLDVYCTAKQSRT